MKSLLVPYDLCIGVDTFQVWFIVADASWSRLRDPTSAQFFNSCCTIIYHLQAWFCPFLPSMFHISGSLAMDAGVKGSEKDRKYDLVYKRVAVHPEEYSTAKIKPHNFLSPLLTCSGVDFLFTANVSLRPATVIPCMLRIQAWPRHCIAYG